MELTETRPCGIARKRMQEESALWLELLLEHQMAPVEGLRHILDETNQLVGIFITSIRTTQSSRPEK